MTARAKKALPTTLHSEIYIKVTHVWDSIRKWIKRETSFFSSLSCFSPTNIIIWLWQTLPPIPPWPLDMTMWSYSTPMLFLPLTFPIWLISYLLSQMQSRNYFYHMQRLLMPSLFCIISASWLSLAVIGSQVVDRLLICYLGIILVQVHSGLKLYHIPKIRWDIWVLRCHQK